MPTITVVVKDNYAGYGDPLIYTVDVENPQDRQEVYLAVESARRDDLGDGVDIDLELLFAFAGNVSTIADWRE